MRAHAFCKLHFDATRTAYYLRCEKEMALYTSVEPCSLLQRQTEEHQGSSQEEIKALPNMKGPQTQSQR